MLPTKLLDRIESNWESILRDIEETWEKDPRAGRLSATHDADIRSRARDLIEHLSDWLSFRNDDALIAKYEELGRLRFQQGMPLHQFIYRLLIVRARVVQFAMNQNLDTTLYEVYGELDLLRALGHCFDLVLFAVSKGYYDEMMEQKEDRERFAKARTAHA